MPFSKRKRSRHRLSPQALKLCGRIRVRGVKRHDLLWYWGFRKEGDEWVQLFADQAELQECLGQIKRAGLVGLVRNVPYIASLKPPKRVATPAIIIDLPTRPPRWVISIPRPSVADAQMGQIAKWNFGLFGGMWKVSLSSKEECDECLADCDAAGIESADFHVHLPPG